MRVRLRCPVRGCSEILELEVRRAICPRGHSFDRSRAGALNLLQPQDRRSKAPGDATEAIDARRRTFDRGLLEPIHAAVIESLRPRPRTTGVLLDVGCGEGAFARRIERETAVSFEIVGVDISSDAVERAARGSKTALWIVANADRSLPLADGSVDAIVSINARVHPVEFARVLSPDGVAVVAVPAPDDLVQLRESVQGRGAERDRRPRVEAGMDGWLRPVTSRRVSETRNLPVDAQRDLLAATYRARRRSAVGALADLAPMAVTLAWDLSVWARGSTGSGG